MGKLRIMTSPSATVADIVAVAVATATTTTTTKLKPAKTTLTTTSVANLTTVFSVILAIGMNCGGTEAAIESSSNDNSLQYKEYWYRTEQLCPDLQEAVAGKDIDTANYPYKSVFRFMDHLQSVSEPYADLPCILEANGPRKLTIEAIHVDTRPWNYSGAETCEEHIKLRLPEPTFLKRSNVPKIICRIPKSRTGIKGATGSLYHPYVWQFQKGKLGLSFSSFNLSHIVQQQLHLTQPTTPGANNSADSEGSQNEQNTSNSSDYWLERDRRNRQFVQIVFTTRFGGMCAVRVQQYVVDPEKTLCADIQSNSPFRLCGLYDCAEKENILRALGFWTHRKMHDQLDILLQSSIPQWRRDEPSYLQVVVSTLRALIMPLLFLSVFYVTRRLRLKLANRHLPGQGRGGTAGVDRHRSVLRQRQCYLRSLMREGNHNNSSSGSSDSGSGEHMLRPSLILNHVVYDIPVNGGEYPVYDDLPPPYESIIPPPSYQVATTQVKQGEGGMGINVNYIAAPPTSTTEGGGTGGDVGRNVSTPPPPPATNSTAAATVSVVDSSASQPNTGSRLSILEEDVMYQTPPETRPSTSNPSAETSSASPPPPAPSDPRV